MPTTLERKGNQLQQALGLAKKIEELQEQLSALTSKLIEPGARKSGPEISPQAKKRIMAALQVRSTARKLLPEPKKPQPRGREIRKVGKPGEPGVKSTPFDPIEAGRKAVAQMQEAEGGAWTGTELESHFSLTPATLHKRRVEHRIVFWRDAKNQFHYPKWQFNGAGALRPGVQEVLQTFNSSDEWRVMRYFLAPRHQLDDRTPLDLLRAGQAAKVIAHAKAHGEENSW